MLLTHGADINIKNNKGETALITACSFCNIPVVKLLIEYGADVNMPDLYGNTPLMMHWAEKGDIPDYNI